MVNCSNLVSYVQVTATSPFIRYSSKYAGQSRKEYTASKDATKTFGVPDLPRSTPDTFLKKGAKFKPVRLRNADEDYSSVKAKIDPWLYIQPHPLSRDFIRKTRNELKEMEPKFPMPACVDRHNGDRYQLNKSGLVPYFVFKPAYGKCPRYLVKQHKKAASLKRTSDLHKARDEYLLTSDKQFVMIKEDERQAVLEKLRHNFDEAIHQFQALSFALDNQTKIKTKTNLERDLNELEKTIDLVSRRNNIVVKMD
ncbi:enkurin-like isoform X2 [Paramacrobiotus metropolitanus]|uniref:enkurin-like isoform X2 n=1 Tax=Paramacrobiotus metropolitanus TaxID=2943436 RepID=UPI0024460F97|nr:enkurin-like isoform X2 [Paramacrobiotus metropolitanus]